MKYSFILSLYLVNIICLTGCKNEYVREKGCHLDKMGINGNVVKVETIVQSSMPLTEMFAKTFDPKYTLTTYGINISIDFDNHGNVKNTVGYGLDGEILFKEKKYIQNKDMISSPYVIAPPTSEGKVHHTKAVYNEKGQVVNIKYYCGDDVLWNQTASYNEDGTMDTIIKEYESFKIESRFYSSAYADTTTYRYLAYDSLNNWIEAELLYKGIRPRHTHLIKIKRQITYFQEKVKPKLINKLKHYNNVEYQSCDIIKVIHLGNYGEIKVPQYMASQADSFVQEVQSHIPTNYGVQQEYLFMSNYDNEDAYASFSINLTYGNDIEGYDNLKPNELAYNKETNKYIEELYTSQLAQNQIYILKWLPYKFVIVSGRRALLIRYFRYGIGSPIPVYCENYTIPMKDGNIININYSYQSNLEYRFKRDFDNAMSSVTFY